MMKDNETFIPLILIAIAVFIFGVAWECRPLITFSGGMFLGIAVAEYIIRRIEMKREEKIRNMEYEARLKYLRAQHGYRNPVSDGKDEAVREGNDDVRIPSGDSVLP